MIDLLLHTLGGALLLAPIALWPHWYVALACGTVLGALREWEQTRWKVWADLLAESYALKEYRDWFPERLPGWLDRRVLRHLWDHKLNNVTESLAWGLGAAAVVGVVQWLA